jgi:hypothetical protein
MPLVTRVSRLRADSVTKGASDTVSRASLRAVAHAGRCAARRRSCDTVSQGRAATGRRCSKVRGRAALAVAEIGREAIRRGAEHRASARPARRAVPASAGPARRGAPVRAGPAAVESTARASTDEPRAADDWGGKNAGGDGRRCLRSQ